MDKLSVIIPCYNHGKYLREAIESLYDNWITIDMEVMVVDDCSTDDSFAIATELSKEFGFQLHKMKENSKPAKVRNWAIGKSTGNLIVCLDGDDKIPPNYLQENYNNIIMYGVDISYNNSTMFGTINTTIDWPEFDIEILRRSPFVHCTSMFKKEVWQKTGGFDELMVDGWEDYDFWLRVAREGFKFKKCNQTFLYYRQSEKSRDNAAKQNLNEIKVYLQNKLKGFYLGGLHTKKQKILSTCSSRNRPDRCEVMIESFLKTFQEDSKLFIYVCDSDDSIEKYMELKQKYSGRIEIEIGPYKNLIEVLNYGPSKYPNMDFYHEVNDDHIFRTVGWDTKLSEVLEGKVGISYGFTHNLPSSIMISGEMIRKLGFFAYPKFQHLYVDNYFKEIGLFLNCLIYVPDVMIEHVHYHYGKCANDDVYKAVYSAENERIGKNAYNEWLRDKENILRRISNG